MVKEKIDLLDKEGRNKGRREECRERWRERMKNENLDGREGRRVRKWKGGGGERKEREGKGKDRMKGVWFAY